MLQMVKGTFLKIQVGMGHYQEFKNYPEQFETYSIPLDNGVQHNIDKN